MLRKEFGKVLLPWLRSSMARCRHMASTSTRLIFDGLLAVGSDFIVPVDLLLGCTSIISFLCIQGGCMQGKSVHTKSIPPRNFDFVFFRAFLRTGSSVGRYSSCDSAFSLAHGSASAPP